MSVVSAGGRRGPPRDYRDFPRAGGGGKSRRGYSQSEIGEPFIPRFSAIASEGVKLQMPHDDYGDNTTVLTGVTSEHSYTGDENSKRVYDAPLGRVVSRRCSRVLWLSAASIVSFVAVVSAPLMCGLPVAAGFLGYEYPTISCEVDCQGYMLLVGIKTLLLLVALWALYWRRAAADLPRLYFPRAALTLFVLFILFAYWLFYTVRILLEKYTNYTYVVTYSLSLLDALLYTHYISVIVLELRRIRTEYVITIVRDPDGESRTLSCGMMSLQEAAIHVLRFYESDFSSYNSSLDKARFSGSSGRHGQPASGAGFKMYDIEGFGGGREAISEANARAIMEAAGRRRINTHQELMQDELDWDRRLKKRKYRLMATVQDAFAQVQGIDNQQGNGKTIGEPMNSLTTAETVFTLIMRPLNKYIRLTRQQQYHPATAVTQDIERCLSMRLGWRTFLERFFSNRNPPKDVVGESKWSIISDDQASVPIQHGSTFLLRSHNKDDDAGVQLLCTVSSLPFFNLTEQSRSSISKFALKISSESSV